MIEGISRSPYAGEAFAEFSTVSQNAIEREKEDREVVEKNVPPEGYTRTRMKSDDLNLKDSTCHFDSANHQWSMYTGR